jgi:hypothetical protein
VPKKNERGGRQVRQRKQFSHETNLRRDVGTRQENRVVLIVTDGKETETTYFKRVREEPWIVPSKVDVTFKKGDPAAAVEYAISEASGYTETWAVCDVDQYDVEVALTRARDCGISLALSNPCFEVWLILHLFGGCGPFDNATQAGVRLSKLLPTWNKTELNFDDFRMGIFEAVKRAKQLAQVHGEPPKGNPSTDVWRVIESLRADSAHVTNPDRPS